MVERATNSGACIAQSVVRLVRDGYSSVALPTSHQQSNPGGLAAQIAEETQGNDQSEDIVRDDSTKAAQFGAASQAQGCHTTDEATVHRRRSACIQLGILDRSRAADHRILQGHQERQNLRKIYEQSSRLQRWH